MSDFSPTDQQLVFAGVVRDLFASGITSPIFWVLRAGEKMDDAPTLDDFRGWQRSDGFSAWWQRQCPWLTKEDALDPMEVSGLEATFWNGLGQGMAQGQAPFFSTYAKIKSDEAFLARLDSTASAMADWLGGGGASEWQPDKPPPPDED